LRELPFDHFLDYEELSELLQDWAREANGLLELTSIGRSWEGRDIWLCTVTNRATGPALEKPALIVEGNIHSVEWTGSTAALHLVRRLLQGHPLLDTHAVYVIPRLNPDGAERSLREGRFIRSSVRPYPLERQPDGLRVQDVDGDGRVLTMRLRDPNGPWKVHPDDARVLVRREPDDLEGEFYRLYYEGLIENYDGVTIPVAPPLEGLDLNRNFPGSWDTESVQLGAGPYPTSEPEVRAYVQAVSERPNIVAHVAYHTWTGVHLRPYAGRPDEEMPTDDLRAYRIIGEKGTSLTGYPAISIYHDFKYDPKQTIKGDVHEWLYDQLGVFSWTTEFWSPPRAAGIELAKPIEWIQDHPPDDDLALVRWADAELGEQGYVDWYPFEHPQLGTVELGGWDVVHTFFNIPFTRLEREIEPHTEWALFQLALAPRLEVRSLESEPVGSGAYRVRLVLANRGWLPTAGTRKAEERKAVRPLEVELELPDGARLGAGERRVEAGQLEGRAGFRSTLWWGNDPSTNDLRKLEWVVESPNGGTLRVEARHQRAGVVRGELRLG
jgi:murein tripeptide amidase MpaA